MIIINNNIHFISDIWRVAVRLRICTTATELEFQQQKT